MCVALPTLVAAQSMEVLVWLLFDDDDDDSCRVTSVSGQSLHSK